MKSIIYTNNATFSTNGITFEKGKAYEVSDDLYHYIMTDYKSWFVVGRPMEDTVTAEPVAKEPVEPAKEPVEPVVEQVAKEATKPPKK
jgi:hypothetical protein